jgi:hypothetical protein
MNEVFAQPVGWKTDVKRPSGAPILAYLIGIVLGACVTAAAIGLVADTLASGRYGRALVFGLAQISLLAGFVMEIKGTIAPLPERRRQVPTRWLAWPSRSATAGAFGLVLGMSVWTLLHHAAIYVLAGCLLLLSLPLAVAVGATYGLTRGALLCATWLAIGAHPRVYNNLARFEMPAARSLLSVMALLAAVACSTYYVLGS